MESENYYKLWSIYEGVSQASSMIDCCDQLNLLTNESFFVAKNVTKSIFHMKRSDVRSLGNYGTTDTNKFITDTERRTRDIICARLSDYIKYLQGFRWGDNKACTLYAYLIFEGLYNILGDIYVPEHLREIVNSAVNELSNRAQSVLTETQTYFFSKGNTELNKAVKSLGTLLLTQRKDQVVKILSSIYEPSSDDISYIEAQRFSYSKFVTDIDHKIILDKFGISDSSYYRHLNGIINDLASKLTENDLELITNLFLRR